MFTVSENVGIFQLFSGSMIAWIFLLFAGLFMVQFMVLDLFRRLALSI